MHVGRSGPAGSVSGTATVELFLAGTFRVVRDGVQLTDGEIGSRKSRTLLKLLAVERPGLVTVDRIVEILWPDERPASPEQNVAIMVSRLRAVLGAELIQGGRAGYRLAAGPGVVVDLDVAAGFCEQAEGKLGTAAAVALAAAERAHELLSAGTAIGDEPYADWADPARDQVRELLRRVRLAAAEASLATGDPRRAAGYAEAAVAADPLDEAAHRWYMSAAAAAGEQAKALAAYEALRQRLGRELGADPAPQTRELHLAILREQDGGLARSGSGRAAPPGPKPGAILLAGRDRESKVLREAWAAAAGGQPGLVTITGEAGIGKTTLAETLAAEAAEDGGTVLRTRCYETERSLFLQPIVEAIAPVAASTPAGMLRQLLGEHATAAAGLLPEVAALLGPPPPGRGSMEMERRRAFEAVRAFLRGLAERNPVLLLVDDLQYAGQSTVELMHFLGREPAGTRLLVLATVRAENDAQVGRRSGPRGPPGRRWGRSTRTRWRSSPARPGGASWPGASWSRPAATPCSWSRCCARWRAARRACPNRCGPPCRPASGAPGRAVETLLRAAAVLGAHGRPADPRRHARPGARDRARAVRGGAGRPAARGQRPRLRVRQRPHPRGAVRQHAGADPAGATTAGPPTC